jgi:enhancing lycopene biosynthesis protein 2
MTTITTDMLRYIAHTLGVDKNDLLRILQREYGTRIDDTPADDTETDTEEQTMTITPEQFEAAKGAAQSAISGQRCALTAALTTLGITITPAEPPAEMVKLARDSAFLEAENARLRQHIADEANRVNIVGSAYDRAQAALDEIVAGVKSRARNALGAGGRDAG